LHAAPKAPELAPRDALPRGPLQSRPRPQVGHIMPPAKPMSMGLRQGAPASAVAATPRAPAQRVDAAEPAIELNSRSSAAVAGFKVANRTTYP
jgi:hypothetical protein